MNTASKFIILYLTPILSFGSALWAYLDTYGKSGTIFSILLLPLIMMAGFLASSFIAYSLISRFIAGGPFYPGIFFAALGWLLEAVVLLLYLMFFHGFLNP